MARFNLVNINDIYFTRDGTISGVKCRINVTGLEDLLLNKVGRNDFDADGNAYVFFVDRNAVTLTLEIEYLRKDVFDDIIQEIQTAMTDQLVLALGISGELGDYNLDVLPLFPKPVKVSGKFGTNRIDGITISFVTAPAEEP